MKYFMRNTAIALIALSTSLQACAQNEATDNTSEEQEAEQPEFNFAESEIFLFDYDMNKNDAALSNVANVTNRRGYDNQPYFTPDNEAFLYVRDDGVQTDIYEYSLNTRQHTRLTNSDRSEFSPSPSPDGTMVSFVFERNNSVWHAKRGEENSPTWSFETAGIIEPVGYFVRNHDTDDILYWSRFGFNISLTNASTQKYHYITGDALPIKPFIIPGTDKFSFIHRQGNSSVWIKELDPKTLAVRPLTPIVGNNANYTWTPDGSIIQIEGSGVFRWTEGSGEGWEKIDELGKHGVKNANRIAISPDGKKIAIVGQPM